jgi:hypothetical protein
MPANWKSAFRMGTEVSVDALSMSDKKESASLSLSQYLLKTNPVAGSMGLIHCTNVSRGLAALHAGSLRTSPCRVYEEDLLYLFYGRPAYKLPNDGRATGMVEFAPVCLVLDPKLLGATVRVLPFDSGGFQRYAPLAGADLGRTDFELVGGPDVPRRIVAGFFGTNRNYFDQRAVVTSAQISIIHEAARVVARLLTDESLRNDDDRCGTIELQYPSAIPLAGALHAIVAPAVVLDDVELQGMLADYPDVALLPYPVFGRFRPPELANSIYERVNDLHARMGAFD